MTDFGISKSGNDVFHDETDDGIGYNMYKPVNIDSGRKRANWALCILLKCSPS